TSPPSIATRRSWVGASTRCASCSWTSSRAAVRRCGRACALATCSTSGCAVSPATATRRPASSSRSSQSGWACGPGDGRLPPLASGDPSCYRHDSTLPATCAGERTRSDGGSLPGTVSVATSSGINPPLYYALVGVPVRWLGHAADSTWYRLVATGWNALVLG